MDLESRAIRSPPIPACTTRFGFIPSRSTKGKCDVYRLYNTDFHRSLRSLLDFACLVATVICATDTSNISNLPSQSLRADWMASHVGSIPCGHGGIYLTYSFHRWIIKSGGLSNPSPPLPTCHILPWFTCLSHQPRQLAQNCRPPQGHQEQGLIRPVA